MRRIGRKKAQTQDQAPLSCEARYLLVLLRDFLNGREPTAPPEGFDEERFARIAKFQRVEPIVADELRKRPELFSERLMKTSANWRAQAILLDVAFETTVARIDALFEKNDLRYLPLKGAITKGFYPQTYQRSVCDYDVLLDERDLTRARELLENDLGYRKRGASQEHYSLTNDSGLMKVELHRALMGTGDDPIFADPASLAIPWRDEPGKKTLKLRFPDEIFYLHMILHIAKHWLTSGVTLRMFVDVLLFNRRAGEDFDRASLDDSFRNAGALGFARNVERAADVWFGTRENDETSEAMARRVLNGAARDFASDPNPFAKRKNRFVDFFERVVAANVFRTLRWEIARKPWPTRPFWYVYYWLKFTVARVKYGGLARRAFAVLFKRNAQETNRGAERRFGFDVVPDETTKEKKV